ncbi:polymerase [Yacaaba virus]|nr:polymerase [Yacaaba virus]
MDDHKYIQIRNRIERSQDPSVAKLIYDDIMSERHDYFGRELCNALGIEYRNDVHIKDILLDTVIDYNPILHKTPNITPDNYYYIGGNLYIIDYKVSVTEEATTLTFNKYFELTRQLDAELDVNIIIVVIRMNPMTKELTLTDPNFLNHFPGFTLDVDFDRFLELKDLLMEKYRDDEEFHRQIGHGDFTLTAPWCETGCPDLYQHPIYKEFKFSMDIPGRRLFEQSLKFDSYSSERWNYNLLKVKEYYQSDYEKFITERSKNIFLVDGDYPQPSHEEIEEGWSMMKSRVLSERNVSNDITKQKPSIHFIWSPNISSYSNKTVDKLVIYSKLLQNMEGNSYYLEAFKCIGKLMDFSEDIQGYESFVENLKQTARKQPGQVQNKKIDPKKIGECTVLWEQQFSLSIGTLNPETRTRLLKDFLGIGKHKTFDKKTFEDLELEKPTILDFDDTTVKLAANSMVSNTKNVLSKSKEFSKDEFILEYFGHKIAEANPETREMLDQLVSTNFWAAINDFSTLMKNILSVSQYNKHNTFRIALCGNNSLFAIVFPSSDIKTKRSTVVFCTVCLHKEEKNVMNCGALHSTFKSVGCYVSISKAIRLDKERCQRIVISPGLFMMNSMLMHNNNPTIDFNDVMTFSFFTSLSITKAMLSLTEPSRYMIMNSLAISSNVKGYIAEKFSPYTKTLFSVYMTNLIKSGCANAFNQRPKIMLRDIFLTDYDIKQKGIKEERNLKSIWFPGEVSLKEYLNQIYLPFYYNAKGLHEKHHVMMDLAKTVLEIEKDQRENITDIWSSVARKQTVNLNILVYSICKNLLSDTSRKNFLRSKIENMNNFRRPITTISTFTSSKSCIKVGDFSEFKSRAERKSLKAEESYIKKLRVANPHFFEKEQETNKISHARYEDLKMAIPNYVDVMSTKVFDRLYEKIKNDEISNRPTIELIMDTMVNHKQFYFSFFNKGQKTAKDREIFVGEFEGKMCLYCLERISKERCKVNPDEMISEPGDSKLKIMESKAEAEIRYLVDKLRRQKKEIDEEILKGFSSEILDSKKRGLKLEFNADMSKWSAQDVLFKYFWLVALDPLLYPQEKERILYFLCNYMQKRLIMPDELLCGVLDQRVERENDIIMEMTEQMSQNYVEIKRNWLQGNLNYTSSYIHSCAMSVYKDILKKTSEYLDGEVLVNSLVHSDDNQTSITYIQNKVDDNYLIHHSITEFENTCLIFGNQVNMKKTYVTNFLKEFVSLFNLYGEPFSIYGRFLLTCVGDCAYLGAYEDLASRISSAQIAMKHGAPPSLVWLSIGISHWITYFTYNMLPGQSNDPMPYFPCQVRTQIPIEIGGILNTTLSVLAITGLESGNLSFLIKLLDKMTPVNLRRETIQNQCKGIGDWDLTLLDPNEQFYLRFLRYLVLDSEISSEDAMGETSDMRARSILTPRKFTTVKSLRRLVSFCDYQQQLKSAGGMNDIFEYMLNNPELLVTKGEDIESFTKTIIYRYNSKRFKESLSIQNPAQLFIEQVLFSKKPVIDFNGIREKYMSIEDSEADEENPSIIGRCTYPEAFRMLYRDLMEFKLDANDIDTIYSYIILNDPIMVTVANTMLLSVIANPQLRLGMSSCTMPEFRNLKLIRYSPALVIRAYNKQDFTIGFADPRDLERDVYHLTEFIETTKLKEKMEKKIQDRNEEKGSRDLQFEVKEKTAFFQICYNYIKSTEHKVKVFILPTKTHTTVEFCSIIQGNTISDSKWFTVHYLKPIVSIKSKGIIQRSSASELNIAKECFKLITHFGDTFVAEESRVHFLHQMIEKFSYKDMKVSDLYEILRRDQSRIQFLPLLWRTGHITQKDVDKFDALKNNERVTWNQWQISRTLDIGEIDLVLTGANRQLIIKGLDLELIYSELRVHRMDQDIILYSGRKLLNARHGLKFEKFKEIPIEEKSYYITYQFKYRGKYTYQILPSNVINKRNTEMPSGGPNINRLVPVCPVNIAIFESIPVLPVRFLDSKNIANFSLTRLEISDTEVATIKRSTFVKMLSFSGPELKCGFTDLSELMRTPELMSLDFDNICMCNLISFAKILKCEGNSKLDSGLLFFSNDPMECTEEESMFAVPIFNVRVSKKAKKNMTYKNALLKLIEKGVAEFTQSFQWTNDGFYSEGNLGIIESLVALMKLLKTNEWSTLLENCIHICMIYENLDNVFHTFQIPETFLLNKYEGTINWLRLRDFIIQVPPINGAPWDIMFEHFRDKSIFLIEKEMKPKETFEDFTAILKKKGGHSMFEF